MYVLWRWWRRIGGWRGILADGLLAWRLLRDRRVPGMPKLLFPLYLLYFFSPINLPFQWIPFLGQVDDLGLALLAVTTFLRLCPAPLVAEHASQLQSELAQGEALGGLGRRIWPSLDRWTQRRW
jgi:uncharacterized membrane protein YkvA (DUF1232 family)